MIEDGTRYWCRRCEVGGCQGPCWICGVLMEFKLVNFKNPYIFEAANNV